MPFERTVRTLLELIRHALHADSITLCEQQPGALPVPGSRLCLSVSPERAPGKLELHDIAPLVEALSLVLAKIEQTDKLHQLLLEAARLECELADCKIAERSGGMLASDDADPEKVRRHVMRVLEPIASVPSAAETVSRLKAELADRKQVSAAKQLLQTRKGFTEQEAYLHLQRASRRNRRTIPQVARDILSEANHGSRRIA